MARILYGVQGEGRGHSSRSRIIIEHLVSRGHEVKVFASHQAYDYLSRHLTDVVRIMGLGFAFDGDRLDLLRTLEKNVQDGTTEAGKTIRVLASTLHEFKPDLAITDFEPFVPYVRSLGRVPFLSIDHQHVLTQYRLEFPHAWRHDYRRARAVVEAMYRFADHYYVTSFFFPPVKRRYRGRSTLVGPILRPEVLAQESSDGDRIVIYATTPGARHALELARATDHRYLAYGFGREGEDGNITFRPPSTNGFLADVAASRAVITNGGYSLMSEALFLGKPIYAIPIGGQAEQMINGWYLERLGYGLHDLAPTPERLAMFLRGLDYFRGNIRSNAASLCGNASFLQALEERIAKLG